MRNIPRSVVLPLGGLITFGLGFGFLLFTSLAESKSPYPLAAGTQWVYELSDGSRQSSLVESFVEVQTPQGTAQAAILRRTDGMDRAVLRSRTAWMECTGINPQTRAVDCSAPLVFFRWPLHVGDHWTSRGMSFTVTAREAVEVPLGRFEQAYRIAYGPLKNTQPLGELWVAEGVGQLRLREADTEFRLVEFHAGKGPELPPASENVWAFLTTPSTASHPVPGVEVSVSWMNRLPLRELTLYVFMPLLLLLLLIFLGVGFLRALSRQGETSELSDVAATKTSLHLASALALGGDLREAEDRLAVMIEKHPNYPDVRHQLATLLHSEGKFEEAEKHWREALRLNPNYVDVHLGLADLFLALNRCDEAAHHFGYVAERHSSFADAQLGYGKALLALKETERAKKALTRAIEINPQIEEARTLLAQCRKSAHLDVND